MPQLFAFDGVSPFDLKAAKNAGAILITGYIVGHPGGMNPIDKARVDKIRSMGMGFLPNWERGAAYLVNCSKADGVAAGREAVTALRALGVPDDGTIACPFSWDTWVDPTQYHHCGDVADGIIEGLAGRYRFSAYGQGGLIDYLTSTGRMQAQGWLSASSSFPGYDAASPRVALVQHISTPVPGTDLDVVTDPYHVGAWWPTGSPYASSSPTDLLEQIMTLPGAPKGLTYAKLLDDIAHAVVDLEIPNHSKGTPTVASILAFIDEHAASANDRAAAVASVANDTVQRVAQLQAAVAALPAAGQPAPAPAPVDMEALGAAVAAAVVAEVAKLTWGVK